MRGFGTANVIDSFNNVTLGPRVSFIHSADKHVLVLLSCGRDRLLLGSAFWSVLEPWLLIPLRSTWLVVIIMVSQSHSLGLIDAVV